MGWGYWRKVVFFFSLAAASAAGLVAVGTYGEGFQRDDDKSLIYQIGVSLAVVAVLGTFIENHLVERATVKARERAIKAETELNTLYTDVLPVIGSAVKAQASRYRRLNPPASASAPDADLVSRFDGTVRTVLEAAVNLTAKPLTAPQARSAYYELTPGGDFLLRGFFPASAANRPRPLIAGNSTGGAHIKTEILDVGRVWAVDGGDPSRVSHLRPTSANTYAAVIAAPVTDGSRHFGMLAVDAPEAGQFVPEHQRLIAALADFLAACRVSVEP
ncbi:GAF domain-containing protein [Streptomyces sp. NPDC012888]|uniref:GAF domain-containing protein n=1 Tax=Streptomyces sp. NPDC012888 TaxID=3364855 RepID=UPI003695A298